MPTTSDRTSKSLERAAADLVEYVERHPRLHRTCINSHVRAIRSALEQLRVAELERGAPATRPQAILSLEVPDDADLLAEDESCEFCFVSPCVCESEWKWVRVRVNDGRGAVIFGATENGDVGVWVGAEPTSRGEGDTPQEAVESAIRREQLRGASEARERPQDVSSVVPTPALTEDADLLDWLQGEMENTKAVCSLDWDDDGLNFALTDYSGDSRHRIGIGRTVREALQAARKRAHGGSPTPAPQVHDAPKKWPWCTCEHSDTDHCHEGCYLCGCHP